MLLRGLLPLLEQVPSYQRVRDVLLAPEAPKTPITLETPDSARGYVLAALSQSFARTNTEDFEVQAKINSKHKNVSIKRARFLVVTARPEDAQHFMEELEVYLGSESSKSSSSFVQKTTLKFTSDPLPSLKRYNTGSSTSSSNLNPLNLFSPLAKSFWIIGKFDFYLGIHSED